MRDGYEPSQGEDGADAGLDEFLCEYVDGTMDSSVRAAFEEYMRLNPSLYDHIECLRETRSVLCTYGCRLRAPAALQQRLRQRLGQEMLAPPPVMPEVADRLSSLAGISSVLLLMCGILAASYAATDSTRGLTATTEQRVFSPPAELTPSAAAMSYAPITPRASSIAVRRTMSGSPRAITVPLDAGANGGTADSLVSTAQPLRLAFQAAALP